MKKAISSIFGTVAFFGLLYLSSKLSNLLSAIMARGDHLMRNISMILFWVILVAASTIIALLLTQLFYRLWGKVAKMKKKS